MNRPEDMTQQTALFEQLCWFVRLRWGAGIIVTVAGLADWYFLDRPVVPRSVIWIGVAILSYNILLRIVLRPSSLRPWHRTTLVTLAWAQVIADLACLSVLIVGTGGILSPLMGFMVFHMVIISMLQQRVGTAYVGALVAGGLLVGALWLGGQFPPSDANLLILVRWMITLLITVHLTSNITLLLHRHRRRDLRQSDRIRAMSTKLRGQQEGMIQQEKMAAMGQMAAGVAHEIANPLACMDSLLRLIERNPGRLNEQNTAKLRDQIARINTTVRQLTDFAHPPSEQWRETSIDEIVGWALQMVRFDKRIRNVDLKVRREVPRGAGRIRARPHVLEQVLVNLILNALDAMSDQAKPRLEIHVGIDGGECFVEVADNGHGITQENMSHLFEPFFTTKPAGKGTGLGLAVSHGTIRDHGGGIEAENTEEGARFRVTLPLASG